MDSNIAFDDVKSRSRRRFMRNTVATDVTLVGAAGYSYAYEPNDLVVSTTTLSFARMPSTMVGTRIGLLSDMHCYSTHSVERTQRAVQLLLDEKPDIVLLAGDYITFNPSRWMPPCAKALAPLTAAPRGVYAVMGNHDWGPWMDRDRTDFITQCLGEQGLDVLRNQSVPVPGSPESWIVGLDDVSFDQQDVQSALRGVPEHAFKILLVHEPDYADQSPPGFALQLSGHSHGGQCRFPGLPPMHLPPLGVKYYEGLNQTLTHPVYTTRGVGTVGLPFRTFCPPEVTIINLE